MSGPNGTVNTASGSNARGSAGGFNASNGAQGAAVHGRNGNSAGAVTTANGNVYAGADGNVYQKTNSGWSKYNNQSGSWQAAHPTSGGTARSSAQTDHPNTTAPTTRQNYGASSGNQRPSTPSYQRPAMNSNSWGQLNRDQTARQYGGYNRGGYGGGYGGGARRWRR